MYIEFSDDLKDMKVQYDDYLAKHISNVEKAYNWLVDNNIISDLYRPQISKHDLSKYSSEEYEGYLHKFYNKNMSKSEKDIKFKYAWLHHKNNNPHHWEYWILLSEDEKQPEPLDMDEASIIEMICDWFSFSIAKGNLSEIFKWYDNNKDIIILSDNTRNKVEEYLSYMKDVIEE